MPTFAIVLRIKQESPQETLSLIPRHTQEKSYLYIFLLLIGLS